MASFLLSVLCLFPAQICTICEFYHSINRFNLGSNSLIPNMPGYKHTHMCFVCPLSNTYSALFSIPGAVYISTANRDRRDIEVRRKVELGLHVGAFGLGEVGKGLVS